MCESLIKEMIDFRARNRLSQNKLATMCGLSVQTICNIENGYQKPLERTRRQIEQVVKD